MKRNKPANGGHIPGYAAERAGSCQDRTDNTALPGLGRGPGNQAPLPIARRTEPKVFNHGSPHRKPVTNPSPGSWRPLLPGVMSIRAWWHRRRARAHLMNELLAAMDPPSRLDREDRMSDPRPVTRCTGSADAQTPPHGQPHTNVRLSKTSTTPAAPPYQPVNAKEPHTKPVTHGTVSSG